MQTSAVGGEECITKMGQSMKASGTMIREMDRACLDYVSLYPSIIFYDSTQGKAFNNKNIIQLIQHLKQYSSELDLPH